MTPVKLKQAAVAQPQLSQLLQVKILKPWPRRLSAVEQLDDLLSEMLWRQQVWHVRLQVSPKWEVPISTSRALNFSNNGMPIPKDGEIIGSLNW